MPPRPRRSAAASTPSYKTKDLFQGVDFGSSSSSDEAEGAVDPTLAGAEAGPSQPGKKKRKAAASDEDDEGEASSGLESAFSVDSEAMAEDEQADEEGDSISVVASEDSGPPPEEPEDDESTYGTPPLETDGVIRLNNKGSTVKKTHVITSAAGTGAGRAAISRNKSRANRLTGKFAEYISESTSTPAGPNARAAHGELPFMPVFEMDSVTLTQPYNHPVHFSATAGRKGKRKNEPYNESSTETLADGQELSLQGMQAAVPMTAARRIANVTQWSNVPLSPPWNMVEDMAWAKGKVKSREKWGGWYEDLPVQRHALDYRLVCMIDLYDMLILILGTRYRTFLFLFT